MSDLMYFILAMIFNHWWRFLLIGVAAVFLLGCETPDCPEEDLYQDGYVCYTEGNEKMIFTDSDGNIAYLPPAMLISTCEPRWYCK